MFRNLENSIEFRKGDIIAPKLPNKRHAFLYTDDDYYIVVSNYAHYIRLTGMCNTMYETISIHVNKFKNEDVFMFGGWKVRAKSIKTGKYKMFYEDFIINIEDTYLKLNGEVREIKLKCLI